MRAIQKVWLNRSRAYKRIFLTDDGKPNKDAELVLADLRRFCYADRTTAKVSPTTQTMDPLAMAFAEGRREVFMRLQQLLNLDESTIRNLNEPAQEDDRS